MFLAQSQLQRSVRSRPSALPGLGSVLPRQDGHGRGQFPLRSCLSAYSNLWEQQEWQRGALFQDPKVPQPSTFAEVPPEAVEGPLAKDEVGK